MLRAVMPVEERCRRGDAYQVRLDSVDRVRCLKDGPNALSGKGCVDLPFSGINDLFH